MQQNIIHRAVGVVCFNKKDQNQIVVVRHGEKAQHLTGSVGLPSGRLEESETDLSAAVREFSEETGLTSSAEFFKDLGFPFEPVKIERKDGTIKTFSWHLFLCKDYSGDLKSSEETTPDWINIKELEELETIANTIAAIKKAQDYIIHTT
jgi:8-oxo-dGTP pyrophosphatase MutT (NUDIX family)